MSVNSGLYGIAAIKDKYSSSNYIKASIAGVFVYEQLAFILDEAQAALMRPSLLTCERALKRIAEMTQEVMPISAKLLSPGELEETWEDIAAELKQRCNKRKAWCPDKTPIAREMDMAKKTRELLSKEGRK